MKQVLLMALGMLVVGSIAVAAEFTTSGSTGVFAGTEPLRDECEWISQNFDPWTVGTTQVACGAAGIYTTENWYARQYFLQEDHYIYGEIGVCTVAFGVSALTGEGGGPPPCNYTFDIVLYTISNTHGITFGWGDVTEVLRQPVTVSAADVLTIVYVDLINPPLVDADYLNIVVAIDAPHGQDFCGAGLNIRFYPAANEFGSLMDSYLASASCGLPDPTPVSAIGFPTSQTILNLCVGADCGEPTPVEEGSWGAVKSLYR